MLLLLFTFLLAVVPDDESLDLPFLPSDRSDFDVHGALLDDKVR